MELNEIVKGITLTKACSIKADKDSDESKVINLKVKFDGVSLSSVFQKALSNTVIQWQNGPGRKGFDSFNNNQVVDVEFKAPGAMAQIDPVTAILAAAKTAGLTIEEYIRKEITARNSDI